MMNDSEDDGCVPINFTGQLIYEAQDLSSAMELIRLSYPNKDNTFGNWGHLNTTWVIAFYIHAIIFSVSFFALGTISLLVLIMRDFQGRRVLKELNPKIVYTLACINVLLVILGYSKFFFFMLDPYLVSGYLDCEYCHIPWSLMESLSLPSLTVAYTMEFFTLWMCIQIVQESVFKKCQFVAPFAFINYAVAMVVQVVANLFVYPGIITIITCTIYFICFGIIVCLVYILTGWRVLGTIKTTARRSTFISSSMRREIPKEEPKNINTVDKVSTDRKKPSTFAFRDKYTTLQKSAIIKISRICYGTAFLGLLLSIVQIVLLVILSRVLLTDCITSSPADKNLWLVFQYMREVIELAMGAILLYCTADFRMIWKCMKKLCSRE